MVPYPSHTFYSILSLTVPRQPGVSNNLFEIFEIEKGISADEYEANDDPGNYHTSQLILSLFI